MGADREMEAAGVWLGGREAEEKRRRLLEAIEASDVAAVRMLLRKGGVAVNDRDKVRA
jgi:hypothetical protein